MFYIFSVISTCVVCFLALVIALFNIYLYIRRRFPVKVNCWFCNTSTKVEYDNQNSFECPTCLQYNGFTKDGGYNRFIPEQHDEYLNKKSAYFHKRPQHSSSNERLCATCNYNQELKVFQLANFVPLVEKNYDAEVEHFEKQLEKAYGLCKRCENVLKKTLQAQSTKFLGNRVRQLQKETASLLDLTKPYKGVSKLPLFVKCIHYSVVLFAVLMFVNAVVTFDYSEGHLRKLLPHFLSSFIINTAARTKFILNRILKSTEDIQIEMNPILQTISEHCSKFSDEVGKLSTNYWDGITESHLIKSCLQTVTEKVSNFTTIKESQHYVINYGLTAISGFLLQLILCFWSKSKTVTKASQVLSWLVLILISLNKLSGKYELLQLFLKLFCPILIIYTMTHKPSPTKIKTNNSKKSRKRKNIRRLVKEDDIFSDLSDSDNSTQHREEREPSFNSIETAKIECDVPNAASKTEYTLPHNPETELNASLSNLDLGSSPSVFNSGVSKPLLSPSRLSSVTRNPWTAGGFWSNPYSCHSREPEGSCNLSRSSSHSSGFGSHTNENLNFNSLPASPGNSLSGGDDRLSVFSEPPYQLGNGQFELYKTGNGAIAASLYSPNSGNFSMHNPFQRTFGSGVVWNKGCRGVSSFSYTSSAVNLNLPHKNCCAEGYAMGHVFKNLGDPMKADSFKKIRY